MVSLLALSALGTALLASSSPKHVMMVVIDDLGFDDMGFANGQINTPTFDALHAGGIGLSQYYVQPSCSPTRATLLTGRKPVHTGINTWIPNQAYGLPLNETTLAQVLNKRGFRSHAVGKWHLGLHKTAYLPTFRGFDSFYGYYEGSEDYWTHNFYGHGLDFHQEDSQNCSIASGCSKLLWDQVAKSKGQCDRQGACSEADYASTYSTHLFSARAVSIIEEHKQKYGAQGLFLYLAYQGVHEPRQAPTHYIYPYNQSISDVGRRNFAGMLTAVDEGVANVTGALKRAGMYADTLVIVTTDNGGPTTECSTTGQSNYPFRGSKCSVWEGGTHGLGLVYWQGLPARVQGMTYTGLIHAADWLPTIVGALTPHTRQPLQLKPKLIGRDTGTGASVVYVSAETLPLDGIDMWQALSQNITASSSSSSSSDPTATNTIAIAIRTHIYYGVNQQLQGPAVRDVDGYKLILAPSGGGKGEWSPEQLPNKSSSSPLSLPSAYYIHSDGSAAATATGSTTASGSWCTNGSLTPATSAPGCANICVQNGTCFPQNDLRTLHLNDTSASAASLADQCCAECVRAGAACVGWTFRATNPPTAPNCFLKSKVDVSSPGYSSGCTSGYKKPTHPVPPSPPAPPSSPHLLYHIPSDPGERTNLSLSTPSLQPIIANLQQIVDEYAKTKVPQAHSDPSCPPFTGLNTTDDPPRLYIGPWCD